MAKTASSKGVSGDRVKYDPVFERTRENAAEFARAGKAAKFMRVIFREVMIHAKDKITQARLVKLFSRIVATDPVSKRGERTVEKGDLSLLKGFNFNERASLSESLFVRCPASIDRATGQVQVAIPAFVPRIRLQVPSGTTHFRIVAAAAAIQFATEDYEYDLQSTPELPWEYDPVVPANLTLTLPPNSPGVIAVAQSVEFYQRRNAHSYVLKDGGLNATSIVKVDVAP